MASVLYCLRVGRRFPINWLGRVRKELKCLLVRLRANDRARDNLQTLPRGPKKDRSAHVASASA